MTEKEILQDLIISSKFLLSMYNQFGLECSTKNLRNLFIAHHAEVSKENFEIFNLMKERNLYPVMEAEEQEIEKAIQMHEDMQDQLNEKL